jgi:hypothetical protein
MPAQFRVQKSATTSSYAKRAAACRIDLLLNHLRPFARSAFPAKITALRQVGLRIPDVVRELVIDPRNTLEHDYKIPLQEVARHAVGVAELFVRATDAERQRSSIVAVAWNVLGSQIWTSELHSMRFRGFSNLPMLFIDVFDEPHAAKIIDPSNSEIRSVPLSAFSNDESLELARLLRSNCEQSLWSQSGGDRTFFEEMKRQGGF